MSYILDALKKIEHEKNKKARPDGRISVAGDLFQERKRPATRAGIWKILLLLAVASLMTFAGTWFLFQGSGKKSTADISPAAQPPPVPVHTPSLTAVTPEPVPAQPQPAPPLVAVPPSATSAPGGVVPKRAETVAVDVSSARRVRSSQNEIKVQSTSPQQPVQTMQAPADIKLSGIAWQDERAARRAVVNGFLLKEGSVVSGAKITAIQADRVRFLSSAGSFEIKLDAVLPAEVKQ